MKISKIFKTAVLFMLVMAMVFTVSCGEESTQSGDKPNNVVGVANEEVRDLGGYKFVMTSPFILNDPDLSTLMQSEIVLEDVRHQIEEDYNCKIEIINYAADVSTMRAKVQSGDKVGDIVDITSKEIIPIIRAGLLQELDNVPGINVNAEYWDAGSREVATFAGHVYALNFMKPIEARSLIVYNKDVLQKSGITEDLTEMVRNGTWTWENWLPMLQKAQKYGTDGKVSVYGLTSTRRDIFALNLVSANNSRIISVNDNGYVKETFDAPNTVEAFNFFFDLVQTYKVFTNASADTDGVAQLFVDGKIAFLHCESWVITQNIKDKASGVNYGVVPVPMGPNGTSYTSNCDHMRYFCITKANKDDLDKTVSVFNAFGLYTLNYDEGEWWNEEIEADYFQEGDSDSVEMYLLTLDSACIDYAWNIKSIETAITEQLIDKTIIRKRSTVAATINAIHGTFDADIAPIFNLQTN